MGPEAVKGEFQKWKYTPKVRRWVWFEDGAGKISRTDSPNTVHTRQTWEETDVDIKILYCGICASDIHTASGGWSKPEYPIVSLRLVKPLGTSPQNCALTYSMPCLAQPAFPLTHRSSDTRLSVKLSA